MHMPTNPEHDQINDNDTAENIHPSKSDAPDLKPHWIRRYFILIIILIVIAISVILFTFRSRLGDFETYKDYGYVGVFLICLVSNATVILPVGSVFAVLLSPELLGLNPAIVGVIGGAGAALGEMSGYIAGYGGKAVIKNRSLYKRIERWLRRRQFSTIFVFSSIGAFSFDLAGLAAGAFRIPIWKFLSACFLGRSLLYIGFAYAGMWGLSLLQGKYVLWGLFGILIVAIIIAIVWLQRKKESRNHDNIS